MILRKSYNLRENHRDLVKNSRLILKLHQRFKSEKHNVFTEKVNKIAFSANNDKVIQSINSIETYACGTTKDNTQN